MNLSDEDVRVRRSCEDRGKDWSYATSQEMPEAPRKEEARKGSSLNYQKKHGPPEHLDLELWLPDCERINFCCFKALHLW